MPADCRLKANVRKWWEMTYMAHSHLEMWGRPHQSVCREWPPPSQHMPIYTRKTYIQWQLTEGIGYHPHVYYLIGATCVQSSVADWCVCDAYFRQPLLHLPVHLT